MKGEKLDWEMNQERLWTAGKETESFRREEGGGNDEPGDRY